MNQNATRRFFWAMLFISFCTVTPKILTSDNSCPCSLSNECPDDSQLLHENSQVLILPCESEHLIRCCSSIPKPIESANGDEFSYNVDQEEIFMTEKETTEYSTEASTKITESEMSDKSWEEYSTVKWLPTEFSTEESTSGRTVLPLTTEVPTDINTMDMDNFTLGDQYYGYEDKNDEPTTTENITTSVDASKEQHITPERQKRLYSNSKQILRSQSAQSRILNKDLTNESSTIRFPYPGHRQIEKKGTSEVLSNAQEQDLIDQVMSFESTKISEASYQVELVASEFKERKEKNVPRRYKLLFPRRAVLDKDYRAKVNVRFLSVPKSVSEKNQQLFQAENMISDTLYTR